MPKLGAKALVSALPYALKADFEERLYRVYMTDSAWSLVVAVTGVKERPTRYIDIIHPPKVDTRTPEQVQADFKDFAARHGLKPKEKKLPPAEGSKNQKQFLMMAL